MPASPASSLSLSSASESSPESHVSFRERENERYLSKMICWLVNDGYKAMKKSIKNGVDLELRSDLGDQNVRIAEVRKMTAAAYSSVTSRARVMYWYRKFCTMRKRMRQTVDEHLERCNQHAKYKKFRAIIDDARVESSGSETSSTARQHAHSSQEDTTSGSNGISLIKNRDRVESTSLTTYGSGGDSPDKKRRKADESPTF